MTKRRGDPPLTVSRRTEKKQFAYEKQEKYETDIQKYFFRIFRVFRGLF
jgi:hypothetical protein